jgi:hypothetical protein
MYQGWIQLCKEYYKTLHENLKELKSNYETIQMQHALANYDTQEELLMDSNNNDAAPQQPEEAPATTAMQVPPFLKHNNINGYNCRVIPKGAINNIVQADFAAQKELIIIKIKGIPASVLKIDFSYKLAAKIRVYTGRGKSFTPYKCTVTFWKASKTLESFAELKQDLIWSKQRLQEKGCLMKVVYVDNCCQVQNTLRNIFGHYVYILLNIWHRLKHWNLILREPTKAQAGTFRAIMSCSVFMIEKLEWNHAKAKLKIKFHPRTPTKKEIIKECQAIVPGPVVLGVRVRKALNYFFYLDLIANLDHSSSGTTSSCEPSNAKPLLHEAIE